MRTKPDVGANRGFSLPRLSPAAAREMEERVPRFVTRGQLPVGRELGSNGNGKQACEETERR